MNKKNDLREISERTDIKKELQNSENRYRSLCNASFEGLVISDNGVILEANTVLSQLSGYPVSELIGMAVVDLFAREVRDDVKAKIQTGYEKIYESVGLTKAGATFPVEVQAREFLHENRRVRCAAIRDLSERYKVMDELRESETKFRAVVTGAHDAIIMIDGHAKIIFWNKAAERIFQYSEKEMMGKNPHEIITPPVSFKKFKEVYPSFQQTGKGAAIGRSIELTALKKTGEEFPIELSLSAIPIKGKWCAIAVIRDITERKKMEAELKRLATTDVLTGVDNRRSFMEKAEHEIRRAQRYGTSFAMIIMDIDFFKSINDKYGHQAGDVVLQKMAQAVKSALRQSDVFGRIGGEEFSIILMETERKTALLTAERIRSLTERLSINTGKERIHITVSIGLTFFKKGDDLSTLSKRSDEALYSAKRNGRNRVVTL
nr:diguanylate cyclase [uncultured Desulfobacter sp.]